MKKHIILPVMALAVMAMASCSDFDETDNLQAISPVSEEVEVLFEASMQGSGLQKTALAGDGTTLNFLGNETLKVVADDADNTTFTVSNSETVKGTFCGRVMQPVLDAANGFVAMYPDGSYSEGKYKMSIPATQTATLNSFGPNANLLIATTTKSAMSFSLKNVCSFVKVTVSVPVEWIKLSANEAIAGDVTVNTDGTCEGGTETEITLQPASGKIATGTYYVAVKPGSVSGLKIESSSIYGAVTVTGDFEFQRAQFHGATFKKVKSAGLDAYLQSLTLADGEVATIELEDYEWLIVKDALQINSSKMVNLKLPESVTSIGEYAFDACENLAYIELPSGITSIGEWAFDACTNLALKELPSGITSIGTFAFYGCTKLALETLPSGITSIGSNAFRGCANLALKTLPSGITSIGTEAFFDCTSLRLTALPSGITSIGTFAFCGCTNLALETLPSGITSIESYAFYGCTKLALETLPSGITSIGSDAFNGCTNLALETLPSGITSIGSDAFGFCTKIENLTILGSPSFGRDVFWRCSSSLTVKVNLETYLKYRDQYPMMVCPNYAVNLDDLSKCEGDEIYLDLATYDPAAVKSALQNTTKNVTLKLPSDVTAIAANAFQDCASLKEIILPEGLLTIGASAFQGTGLSEITVPASVTSLGKNCLDADNLTDITFLSTDLKLPLMDNSPYQLVYNDVAIKYTTIFKDLDITVFELFLSVRFYEPEKDPNSSVKRTIHIKDGVDAAAKGIKLPFITIETID